MKTLKEWNFKLKLVRTRRRAILHVIELDKNHFFIETLKDRELRVIEKIWGKK